MKTCGRYKSGKCLSLTNPQPFENFSKNRCKSDGLTSYCKLCLKEERETHKDQRRETIKQWRIKNNFKMSEYRKKDAKRNVERTRKWREKNRLNFLYGITNERWKEMFDLKFYRA